MGPNIGPTWAPRGPPKRPKSAFEIDRGSPFFGFDVGKPWETDLGAIWAPSWGRWGPILGVFGANLEPSWAHLGLFGAILVPSWAILGPSSAPLGHLGVILGPYGNKAPRVVAAAAAAHVVSVLFLPFLDRCDTRPSTRPGGMREALNKV